MAQFKRPKRPIDGILLLDKPLNITSNSALQRIKHMFHAEKAGHTGVLDPLATGLLPICIGEATKFTSFLLAADKAYIANMRLGQTTSTLDAEGDILVERPVVCSEEEVRAAILSFLGPIEQVPPMYSALKFQGKALYEYARNGIEIERQARSVTILDIKVLKIDLPFVDFSVTCSKGTYIRTLAQDIGEKLGCGAHLVGLRRTQTGGFDLEDALSLEALEQLTMPERDAHLLPVDTFVLHFDRIELQGDDLKLFLCGAAVQFDKKYDILQVLRAYDASNGDFLGLGEIRAGHKLQPIKVLSNKAIS